MLPPEVSPPPPSPGLAPLSIASGFSTLPIHYGVEEIPLLGGPSVRLGGGVRSSAGPATRVHALGPEHVGWTSVPAPTLYWSLSEPSDLAVEIALSDDYSVEPLFEVVLPGPHEAGLHALSLAAEGVRLEPGELYRWQVSLVVDTRRRAADLRASVALRLELPDAETAAALAAGPSAERVHRYAARGYWYDAFALLSRAAAEEPEAPGLRAAQASLLRQVGLAELAVGERR